MVNITLCGLAEVIAADTSGLTLETIESWERVPLAEIASILNGAPFDSALFNSNDGMSTCPNP